MSRWTVPDAKAAFLRKFCLPASSTYLPMEVLGEPQEIVPGTVFQFDVEHKTYSGCVARMYCGLAHDLGGRMWLQEAQSLVRLSARPHPALPRVREGLVRDEDGIGLLLSDGGGSPMTREATGAFRADPTLAFRYFSLVADGLRELHSHGLLHRNIWRESFEEIVTDAGAIEIRLFGFEMSAFVAALGDPSWRRTDGERQRLREHAERGGSERRAYQAPENVADLVLTGLGLSYRSDVFSLGVLGFQWFVDDLPDHLLGAPGLICHDEFAGILHRRIADAKNVAAPLRDLLQEMLRIDPKGRPTSSEVVSHLARHEERICERPGDEERRPYLLTIAPEFLARFIQIDEWKANLPTDPDMLLDVLKNRIERDLVNGVLLHEPTGASQYVQGGDRESLTRSTWVLLGRRAAYFCQPYMTRPGAAGVKTVLEWALHINYAVDRCKDNLRNIGRVPLRQTVRAVKVVRHQRSLEVDPTRGKGRHPSWTPLLNRVRVTTSEPEWETAFKKGFQWWLGVQRALVDVHQYAFKRAPASPGPATGRTIRLVRDPKRDERWIETDELRHLFATRGKGRPLFGDFFETLVDRGLGDWVTWHEDVGGRPERRSLRTGKAHVRRISPHEVELHKIEGELPPESGWLRPIDDIAADILLRRQSIAAASLAAKPELMQALYDPRSFRGSRKAWEHAAADLDGPARAVVTELLAHFPFYAIQGPPGTGKTTVVAHALKAYLKSKPGARVLIAAQSHFALDELAERLILMSGAERHDDVIAVRVVRDDVSAPVRDSVRRYSDTSQAERRVAFIADHHLRTLNKRRPSSPHLAGPLMGVVAQWEAVARKSIWEVQDRIWRGANMVFATCGTCTDIILGHHDELDDFDWVIVEEAAKAWPAELIMPLVLGRRWTLIGDHRQLGPYDDKMIRDTYDACVTSNRPDLQALVDSGDAFKATWQLFGRLFEEPTEPTTTYDVAVGTSRRRPIATLSMQFRMHEDIASLVSDAFYAKTPLDTAEQLKGDPQHGIAHMAWFNDRSLLWLDTGHLGVCRHESGYWSNDGEAQVLALLLAKMQPLRGAADPTKRLAVLSPYHAQNNLLRQRLPLEYSDTIHTTDSFQGQEADVVVVSLVRTNDQPPENAFGRIGHLAIAQRTNVLLSRAKHLLVIVGDYSHFRGTLGTDWGTICRGIEALRAKVTLTSLGELR